MKRLPALRLALLALALPALPVAAAPSRSGTSVLASEASLPALPDRVFASGLETAPAGAAVTVYTDRAAFLAAIAPGYAEHDFSEIAPGPGQPIHYTDGSAGYNYFIFTGIFAHYTLYNGAGFVSPDRLGDPVSVLTSIDDPPITAIGGNVWPSDFSLLPTGGSIVITVLMQDGSTSATETLESAGPDDFRGFVSAPGAPIAGLFINATQIDPPVPGESPDRWPTLDNLVVGSAP